MTDPNVVWFKVRHRVWSTLVKWWPNKKLDPSFMKMPLAELLTDELLDVVFQWQPDEQLLVDVRKVLIEHGHHQLAERVTVALIQIRLLRGSPVGIDREPTPDWYLWLMERAWVTDMPQNPKHLALRLRVLADQIEKRASAEGFVMRNQLVLEFGDPGRPY